MELRKSGSEVENDCCFTFLASHGCAKMTGSQPVSFISCIFPDFLSSILSLRTYLLLEILISVSGAGRQPLMHFWDKNSRNRDQKCPQGGVLRPSRLPASSDQAVKRSLMRSVKLRWMGVFSSPQSSAKVSSAWRCSGLSLEGTSTSSFT